MSNVEFQNAIPSNFVLKRPISTSKSILRKNLMELLPSEQSTFSSGSNGVIRFQISSNSDILCGPESYFRFDYENKTDSQIGYSAFDVGGIEALFKSIEIRSLGSGILLQRYDQYNRWNVIQSLLHDTRDEVMCSRIQGGDDLLPFAHADSLDADIAKITGTVTVAAGGAVTGTSTFFLMDLKVGDEVLIHNLSANGTQAFLHGQVLTITSNTACTVTVWAAYGTLTTTAQLSVKRRRRAESARMKTQDGNVHTLCFKPRLSLLTHNIPLFLMKGGIEIAFELEDGGKGCYLASTGDPAGALAIAPITYEITRPRFFGMMITPHPDIVDEYIRQWKSPAGLLYSIPSVRYRRNGGTASEANPTLHYAVGVRSARRAYLVIQDSLLAEGASTSAYANAAPSISHFLRSSIRSYQFRVGSHEFPNRAVQTITGNAYMEEESFEAWQHLRNVSGSKDSRLRWSDWCSTAGNHYAITSSVKVADARHFIMAVDLCRDKGVNGDLTGADLSIVPLDVDLMRASDHTALGYTGTPIYHLFVEHDSFLKISSEQMSVMN